MCSGSLSGCLTTSLSGVWKVSSLQRPSKLRHVHQGALEDLHNHLPAGPGVLVVHKLCQDLEKTHLRVVVRLVNALDDMLLQLELDSQLVRLVLGRQQLFRNICNVVWTQQLLTGPRRCAWSQIVLIKWLACYKILPQRPPFVSESMLYLPLRQIQHSETGPAKPQAQAETDSLSTQHT